MVKWSFFKLDFKNVGVSRVVGSKIWILLGLLANIAFSQNRYFFTLIFTVGGSAVMKYYCIKLRISPTVSWEKNFNQYIGLQPLHFATGMTFQKNPQLDSNGASDVKKKVEKPSRWKSRDVLWLAVASIIILCNIILHRDCLFELKRPWIAWR